MTESQFDYDSDVLEEEEVELAEPNMFKIILLNDDYTPMDLVMEVLISVFRKSDEQAFKIMLSVHENGSEVVAVYQEEIAKMKQQQAIKVATEAGYPLQVRIEEEAAKPSNRGPKF